MTALALIAGKLDPTVVIGTKLKEFKNKNFRVGKSKYLIIEACEYRRSFLHFKPNILVITNIEAEHLDYYKDLEDYQNAFHDIAKKVSKDGYIVVNSEEKNLAPILKDCPAQIIKWKEKVKAKPGIPGEFNLVNATNAAMVGELLGVSEKNIHTAIMKYKGSWRRMDYKKKKLGKTQFIDDYGHHPTEVRVTLAAIRERHPDSKILCVFQPHQHSRTKMLLKEFGHAFNSVDQVIIPNIYQVRDSEEVVKSINVDDLVNEIKNQQPHVKNGENLEKTAEYIKENHKKYDIIVTMGAGDISKIYKLI
jgi:UDP-N-acetylmuramate--alanine ligase